jgi:hypothetical protein
VSSDPSDPGKSEVPSFIPFHIQKKLLTNTGNHNVFFLVVIVINTGNVGVILKISTGADCFSSTVMISEQRAADID